MDRRRSTPVQRQVQRFAGRDALPVETVAGEFDPFFRIRHKTDHHAGDGPRVER